MTTRRLIGSLVRCGDPDCDCIQPVIVEEIEDGGDVERITFWEGTFETETSPAILEALEDELAAAAERHGLERQWGEVEVIYEREV